MTPRSGLTVCRSLRRKCGPNETHGQIRHYRPDQTALDNHLYTLDMSTRMKLAIAGIGGGLIMVLSNEFIPNRFAGAIIGGLGAGIIAVWASRVYYSSKRN